MSKSEERTLDVRHDFTDDEMDALATALVDTMQEVERVELEKKEAMDVFKGRLSGLNKQVKSLAGKRRNGWELRPRRCRLRRDYGRTMREWVDVETGEVVREEPFTAEDHQYEAFEK